MTGKQRCDVSLEILLAAGRFDVGQLQHNFRDHDEHSCHDPHCDHHADHAPDFSTWSFETDQPLSIEALRQVVARLPNRIYRAKGIVHSTDAPERRSGLQVIGKRIDIYLEEEWSDRTPRIIDIGTQEALDGDGLSILPAPDGRLRPRLLNYP